MAYGPASILACGYAECEPALWSRRHWEPEPFAKMYFCVAGEAVYENTTGSERLQAGRVYFFPPHQSSRHVCRARFDVHWMHIGIDSPLLDRRLTAMRRIESWSAAQWASWKPVYERLREFAERRGEELELRLQALLLHAFAELCARHPESADGVDRERFAPALRFMDGEYLRNPSLNEIAAAMGLSPSHFHREFTAAFGVTPHAYLLRRRMDLAQQLLARTRQPIREVAAACGYADQFYFSRVFKRWSRLSPERYRAERGASP